MCGPSASQQMLAGQQQNFSTLLSANYSDQFAKQSDILSKLNATLAPIVSAGVNQQGFGAPELAALTTGAHETVARNYAKGKQALNNTLAYNGGGNEVLPTGARAALNARLVSNAANEMSDADLAITQANYDQGRRNFESGVSALGGVANSYNPATYGGLTTSANNQAFGEATKVQDMKNQKQANIIGGITGLATNFLLPGLTAGIGALSKGLKPPVQTGAGSGVEFS
jgi:hypothetical protein